MQTIELKVVLHFSKKNDIILIDKFHVPMKNKEIQLFLLIDRLKNEGFPLENNHISYYLPTSEMNIVCGYDPISKFTTISAQEIIESGREIHIICNETNISLIHQLLNDDINEMTKLNEHADQKEESNQNIKCRRTKERKIGYIIEKVALWRQYYSGNEKENEKLSLEDAAKKVGISKKSLDDYLLQIRLGKTYGFNFNEHFNDKVGVLRTFVKKNRPDNAKKKNKRPRKEKMIKKQEN